MTSKLHEFAKSMFDRFESEGIQLHLAGGWAVNSFGFARNTLDLDWVCRRSQQPEATALMDRLGFVPRSDGMATRFQYGRDLAFPLVDLIWTDDRSFELLRGEIDPSYRVRVINFEGLIAMKLSALRDDERRKGRDLRDLQELLQCHPGRIDVEELRAMCLKYAGEGAFEKLSYRG